MTAEEYAKEAGAPRAGYLAGMRRIWKLENRWAPTSPNRETHPEPQLECKSDLN